jgi:hypothetical protein
MQQILHHSVWSLGPIDSAEAVCSPSLLTCGTEEAAEAFDRAEAVDSVLDVKSGLGTSPGILIRSGCRQRATSSIPISLRDS